MSIFAVQTQQPFTLPLSSKATHNMPFRISSSYLKRFPLAASVHKHGAVFPFSRARTSMTVSSATGLNFHPTRCTLSNPQEAKYDTSLSHGSRTENCGPHDQTRSSQRPGQLHFSDMEIPLEAHLPPFKYHHALALLFKTRSRP